MILKAYPRVTFGLKTFGVESQSKKLTFDGLFVLVNEIYDELHLEKSDTFSVKYFDQNNNPLEVKDDLVAQAASYLEKYLSIKVKVRVLIKKNVPLSSGLAGTAACAAALIKYYADFYELPVSFYNLATQLNENIPFFLTGFKAARVQNLGDQVVGLTNLKLPPMKLHFTNIATSKTLVLEAHKTKKRKLPNNYVSVLVENITSGKPFNVYNELQTASFSVRQDLLITYAKLKSNFNQVFVSGYGSTLVEIKDPYFAASK